RDQHDAELAFPIQPERALGLEADALIIVVAELLQKTRYLRRGLPALGGQGLGLVDHVLKTEFIGYYQTRQRAGQCHCRTGYPCCHPVQTPVGKALKGCVPRGLCIRQWKSPTVTGSSGPAPRPRSTP